MKTILFVVALAMLGGCASSPEGDAAAGNAMNVLRAYGRYQLLQQQQRAAQVQQAPKLQMPQHCTSRLVNGTIYTTCQ